MTLKISDYFPLTFAHDFLFRIKNGGRNVWEVSLENDSISVKRNGRLQFSLDMLSVDSIYAENKDMFTYEEIFLIFGVKEKRYWIGEHFQNFENVLKALEIRFPFLCDDWYVKLNESKAFEKQQILLWKK